MLFYAPITALQIYPKRCLELPIFVNGLNGPVELLTKCLRKEALNGDVELFGEDYSETRIDVVLIWLAYDLGWRKA